MTLFRFKSVILSSAACPRVVEGSAPNKPARSAKGSRTPPAFFLFAALIIALPLPALAKKSADTDDNSGPFAWENAVIHIEVTSKEYSYIQPWALTENTVFKTGVVVEGHQIITTAAGMADQTEIRLQKGGGGLFSLGRVVWVDYQANLAAITTDEPDFWKGLQPAKLADPTPVAGSAHILRWDGDDLDDRSGDIERLLVDNSMLSFVSVPYLKITSTVNGVGFGEAAVDGNRLIGLVCQQGGDSILAIPSSFISSILKARAAKTYSGLGYFDFTWDPVQNPLCLDYLKLPGPARGVIIKETGLKPGVPSPVKPHDVLLQVDGFDIDAEGNYHDPQYHKLCLENLSSRGKWAGQSCRFKIWRDGKEMDITYILPKAEYSDELVPAQSFDQEPQYVLAGGFIFVPLTDAYLRSWGADWQSRAPFRLAYYALDKVTPEHPERVVLSQVLPDEVNLGYESLRNVVVDQINGMPIRRISDVAEALKKPQGGYDVFIFAPGEAMQKAVLDANALDEANQKIMARFHIPADHVLGPEVAQVTPAPTTSAPVAAAEARP
jgi:hypothetical protein